MATLLNNMTYLKVSTYAKKHNISTQYVYKAIRQGKIESTKIDGVCFVITKKED